jgi:exopolyphosphatase/pppGpp-phosphohydrolase
MPLAARRQIIGLPPNRADVILFGVAIYERVMTTFGFTNLRVSTRGLRYAALLETRG